MRNENPLVSVIVTTYNRKQFLKECLDSIFNQTFTDFELIVVDNYSNYDFFAFIESFADKRIRPYQNINNGIIAVNRNYGIRKARGKYIAFCDDDDWWYPEKLSEMVKIINSSNADIFCHDELKVSNGQVLGRITCGPHSSYEELLFNGNCISPSATIVRRSSLVDANYFDERYELRGVEDYDLWLRMAEKKKIFKYHNEVLSEYIIHGNNEVNTAFYHKKQLNLYNIHFSKINAEKGMHSMISRKMLGVYLSISKNKLKNRQYLLAAKFLLVSFVYFYKVFLLIIFSKGKYSNKLFIS